MNYTDYGMIEQKLREGMFTGNMHKCLRDVGRIAGGCLSSGRISQEECDKLRSLAINLANNKREAERKWDAAIKFGQREPLDRTPLASPQEDGHAISWDEVVAPDDYKIVDEKWLETEVIDEPTSFNPCKELTTYLTTLFEPSDKVSFCTDPWNRDGKWIPNKGTTKTVEEMLKYLKKGNQQGFEEAVGTLNNEVSGAWIRINPFNGEGCRDENVTDYRYALVECDAKPVDEQVAIYRKLELPCAAIIHSGGKSAHAIVRVNASSLEEYRKRVDFLYEVCANNGLSVDKQNRNPSRYSRMPGVIRNGNKQFIIDRNCGKASWDEWEQWIKDLNDDLPEFEPLTDEEFKNPPPLAPELIEGVLRINHKMCVVGPSKAGKSFLLIELAIAIAEGGEWLGRKCRQGRVLYINLELDRSSCTHRFIDVYNAMGIPRNHSEFIERWNLRGRTMTLDKLTPKLIRRAEKNGYAAIIIDPIYKVLTGDENSASDMAEFCNYFDRISHDCGCALIYCHHHSKGGQGDKRSMDRASGSGVFARDPDAMIDLLPLDVPQNIKDIYMAPFEVEAMSSTADAQDYSNDWMRKVSLEDKQIPNRLMNCLEQIFDEQQLAAVYAARQDIRKEFDSVTAWRASFTLREFASPSPQNFWFHYPLHDWDETGLLKTCEPEGSQPKAPWQKKSAAQNNQVVDATPRLSKSMEMKQLIEFDPTTLWTVDKVMERMRVSRRSVYNYIRELGWSVNKNAIVPATEGGENDDVPF